MAVIMRKVYVASRTAHASMWRQWRSDLADSIEIVSSWIDVGPIEGNTPQGDSAYRALWCTNIEEVHRADAVVAYHDGEVPGGEDWKGVLVEIGAALGEGKPVYVVGRPPGSWMHHPRVGVYKTLSEAFRAVEAMRP